MAGFVSRREVSDTCVQAALISLSCYVIGRNFPVPNRQHLVIAGMVNILAGSALKKLTLMIISHHLDKKINDPKDIDHLTMVFVLPLSCLLPIFYRSVLKLQLPDYIATTGYLVLASRAGYMVTLLGNYLYPPAEKTDNSLEREKNLNDSRKTYLNK